MQNYELMTDEQLIRKLRNGESAITDYIMNKYKYLVRRKAKAMYLLGGENDDLIQEGMIGLFKAIRDYDLEQEVSFYSFAELCISRQLYSAVKASQRKKHMPLNSYVSIYDNEDPVKEEKQQPLVETIQAHKDNNPEEIFLNKEYMEKMQKQLQGKLSDLESRVLYLHLLGEDYKTIAGLLNKSPKSIDNTLQRIKNKITALVKKK